ncbi:MAG: hypothetical protein WB384_21400 [Candidatus Sulfotelmatobacter sp.]
MKDLDGDEIPQRVRARIRRERTAVYGAHASSGCTAMKTLGETSVAAVLLEYKHEGMDAEAVACHIKQPFPKVPIILLQRTARCQSESCGWWMNT